MSTFVENNSQALSVLKKNLDNLKIVDNSEIYSEKTTTFFKKARNKDKFEIIFLDPPFVENFFIEELEMIKKSFIYKKEHLIVVHREVKSKDKLDDVLNVFLTRSYGRSKILFGNF
jgi:16S rRNA G966 N2-methylase RsmD